MSGSSARENDADVRAFVASHNIDTVLDLGAGSGTYHEVIGDLVVMDAVEVWPAYVERYELAAKYRHVWCRDIRRWRHFDYDLVICGDVLEHMAAADSLALWGRIKAGARRALMSVPVVHFEQGPLDGNPFEVHVQEDLTVESVRRDYGPFTHEWLYRFTGAFVWEREGARCERS